MSGQPGGLAGAVTTTTYPLSHLQESLWPPSGQSAINVPAVARFRGRLAMPRLLAALETVVQRHEALRTTAGRAPDGSLEQRVSSAGSLDPDVVTHRSGSLRSDLAELLLAGSERPFQVDGGPLARAELHAFGAGEHLLIVWMHHVISDLVSGQVLADEISQLYGGAWLPRPGLQMGGYAIRERAAQANPVQERYWARALRAADDWLGLPGPAPGEHLAVRPALPLLTAGVTGSLSELATAHRATLTAVLAAAVTALHAGQAAGDRMVIGLTISNRDRPQHRQLIGCLADQLPVVVDIHGDPSFAELLIRVREAMLDAFEHRLPLGVLRPWLWRKQPPLFAVNLNFLPPGPAARAPAAGGLEAGDLELPYGVVKTRPDPWWLGDAVLAYRPRISARGIGGEIEGDSRIHGAAAVAGFGERFGRLLTEAARDPRTRVSRLAAG